MTQRKDDGGPAFPQIDGAALDQAGVLRRFPDTGMSLRDWFAGTAPTAPDNFTCSVDYPDWLAISDAEQADLREKQNRWIAQREAEWRSLYANAMLAQRTKENG